MALMNLWSRARRVAAMALLSFGVVSGASATTLGDVTLSARPIFSGPSLDIIVDDGGTGDFFLEATDSFLDVFVFVDFDDLTETGVESSGAFDLDATDGFTFDNATGSALDFAFDYAADTLSILYALSNNDFSIDPFGVAVLFFSTDIDATFGFSDLDGEAVEFELFGATSSPAVVPVPAALPLMLAGLLGFVAVGRRRQRT